MDPWNFPSRSRQRVNTKYISKIQYSWFHVTDGGDDGDAVEQRPGQVPLRRLHVVILARLSPVVTLILHLEDNILLLFSLFPRVVNQISRNFTIFGEGPNHGDRELALTYYPQS